MDKFSIGLLDYLVKVKRAEAAATECKTADGLADICSIENGKVYEYEIKTSFRDAYYGELDKPKKHKWYREQKYQITLIPNYFSFVVPKRIVSKFRTKVDEFNPKYGLIYYEETDKGVEFKTVRRPKRLHKGTSSRLKKEIRRRMLADNVKYLGIVAKVKEAVSVQAQISDKFTEVAELQKAIEKKIKEIIDEKQ